MQPPHKNARSLLATWVMAVVLAALSLIAFPLGILELGSFLFPDHRPYGGSGGNILDALLFFFILAPLGLFYWLCWGTVVTLSEKKPGLGVAFLWFLGLILAATIVIRLFYGLLDSP